MNQNNQQGKNYQQDQQKKKKQKKTSPEENFRFHGLPFLQNSCILFRKMTFLTKSGAQNLNLASDSAQDASLVQKLCTKLSERQKCTIFGLKKIKGIFRCHIRKVDVVVNISTKFGSHCIFLCQDIRHFVTLCARSNSAKFRTLLIFSITKLMRPLHTGCDQASKWEYWKLLSLGSILSWQNIFVACRFSIKKYQKVGFPIVKGNFQLKLSFS